MQHDIIPEASRGSCWRDEEALRLAAENDARGHRAPGTKACFAAVKEKGLRGAFAERDAKFGDGRARVDVPEIRDERGHVIEPGS